MGTRRGCPFRTVTQGCEDKYLPGLVEIAAMPTLKKNVKPQMPLLNAIRYTKYQYQFDQLYMYIYNFIYSSICFR